MINIKDKLNRSNILIKRTDNAEVEYVPVDQFEADVKALNERINELDGIDIDANTYVTKTEFNSDIEAINNRIAEIPYRNISAKGYRFYNNTFEVFPDAWDFSEVSNFRELFYECNNLTTFNADITGSMAEQSDRTYMFYHCDKLEHAPSFYSIRTASFLSAFGECKALKTAPSYDLVECVSTKEMFKNCKNLIQVGDMNRYSSNLLRDVNSMFYYCSSLTTAPKIDTHNVTDFNSMFYQCSSLTTAPAYDASKASDVTYTFSGCSKLQNFGGLQNIKIDLDLKSCSKLNYESMINQINGLYDFRGNGDNETTRTLKLFYYAKDELTDDDIAIGTAKGWVITLSF